jgi:hypothetical protein
LVTFAGIDGYFTDLLNDQALVRQTLFSSARREHRVPLERVPDRAINVHVRLGDFRPDQEKGCGSVSGFNVRQPISWFVDIVQKLRRHTGSDIPVSVFSDGTDEALRPLLALPNSKRVTFGSSLADLFALSSAKIIVASGSTFSMWAAYLGGMPVIWPRGQRRQRLHGSNWEYESEVGTEALPERVTALVRKKLCE